MVLAFSAIIGPALAYGFSPDAGLITTAVFTGAVFAGSFIPMPSGISLATFALTDLEKPAGAMPGTGGGIRSIIYAALEDDIEIANFPSRQTDKVTILTDLPFKANKYLHRIYGTEKTIEPIEKKLKGPNRDSGGYEISLKYFHPAVSVAVQEFKAKHSNSNFFLILKVYQNGAFTNYLIGEPYNTAWMDDYETKFGKDQTEAKGTDFTFLCYQGLPMAIYQGATDALTDNQSSSY